MSIEANIQSLTLAVTALTSAIQSFLATATPGASFAASVGATQDDAPKAGKRGPGRPTKETTSAAPPPAATADGSLASGDGTTFWFNTKHDSVYRIVPGDGTSAPLPGSEQISEADFFAHQTRLAAKYGHLSGTPTASPAPEPATSAPTATVVQADAQTAKPVNSGPTAKPADFNAAKAALLALATSKSDGRARVVAILTKHAVNSVPELNGKSADVLGAVVADAEEAAK